jgi:hypothetical protein
MKDWIPLLQTLVWPLFVVGLLYLFRSHLDELILTIKGRIEKGDSFEAGTSGIKLGSSAPQAPSGKEPLPGVQPLPSTRPVAEPRSGSSVSDQSSSTSKADHNIFLVHTARRDKSLDKGQYEYYRLKIFLEGKDDGDLEPVAKVIYHLHPSFYNPDRTVTDRDSNFELRTAAWGMFNLTADVYIRDRKEPLRLERYLNF